MLYHFLYSFHETIGGFNVFRYITFRALCAGLTALFLTFALGPRFIRALSQRQIGQSIREDGPQSHQGKKGTPTMGGLLILLTVVTSTLLWADLSNPFIWIIVTVVLSLGFVGWMDDYLKVQKKNSKGLSERAKLFGQSLIAVGVMWLLYFPLGLETHLSLPFFRQFSPDIGLLYLPLAWLVVVGSSNAVNLTDGLDGLAIGPIISTAMTFGILSYLAGHAKLAEYLYIPYVKNAGELSIFCMAVVCSGVGFLWFNTYPAQVFMGDVGALSLGGALGTVALMTKNELVLVLVGGVFVLEAISVIAQVTSFKTRKKRVFRMAPIHHHFELSGWAEPQVTVRFWIISFILAMLGLATLKLR